MAKAIGSGWWPGQTNESEESQEFWMQYGEHLTALSNAIGEAFKAKDGSTLLLMDSSLRALIVNIADGLLKSSLKSGMTHWNCTGLISKT